MTRGTACGRQLHNDIWHWGVLIVLRCFEAAGTGFAGVELENFVPFWAARRTLDVDKPCFIRNSSSPI
jgi:hypothetical protein